MLLRSCEPCRRRSTRSLQPNGSNRGGSVGARTAKAVLRIEPDKQPQRSASEQPEPGKRAGHAAPGWACLLAHSPDGARALLPANVTRFNAHRVAYDVRMVWFFERGNELLRIETSYDRVAGVFLLRAQRPDGTEEVEKFSDEIACQQRLEALDNQLRSERWGLKQVQPLDTAH